ncbi:hypothetical protein CDAR_320121 [Caerostris darwini]|uniref:Secreted protein n=1 Tax=Caerostris darwini TaxID=1538125 RepID=A0AAV4WWD9_9ARAC|nr:hypothetical protein CDAR_320121 [Caerostris darwini]
MRRLQILSVCFRQSSCTDVSVASLGTWVSASHTYSCQVTCRIWDQRIVGKISVVIHLLNATATSVSRVDDSYCDRPLALTNTVHLEMVQYFNIEWNNGFFCVITRFSSDDQNLLSVLQICPQCDSSNIRAEAN